MVHPWDRSKYEEQQLAIGSVSDHMHLLIGLHPTDASSNLIKLVKGNSSRWINDQGFVKRKFEWQEGYGVFSHSNADLEKVRYYVEHQKEHHAEVSFHVEFLGILKKAGVVYNEDYLFQWINNDTEE